MYCYFKTNEFTYSTFVMILPYFQKRKMIFSQYFSSAMTAMKIESVSLRASSV